MSVEENTGSATSFARRVVLWFLLAVAILCVIALSAQRTTVEWRARNQWVEHTYQVLEVLDDTYSMLKDVQSSVRGYVITGEDPYLIAYDNALPQIAQDLSRFKQLTADNAAQQEGLAAFEAAVSERVARASEVIAAYRKDGQQAAFAIIKDGKGARAMGDVRNRVLAMERTERDLLVRRQDESQRSANELLVVGSVGMGACLAILALVFWMIHNEGKRRAASEASLKIALNEMKRITGETRLVSRVGDFLQGCRTMAEAFQVVSEYLPLLLPGTSGMIGLINNSRNLVETAHHWGPTTASHPDFVPDECWALRRGSTHLVSADEAAPKCEHLIEMPATVLCMPMIAHGETLGLLSLHSTQTLNFPDSKLAAARSIAEQVSLALANLRLQEVLRTQSTQDPLTGLFNRRYMEATLERETARARRLQQPLSIIMLDVDHFKRFNDTHGHEAGDAVLTEMGRLLRRHSRTEDIACRYGGEEFLLILPGASLEIAAERAELLRTACKELSVQHNQRALGNISLSLGVASYPQHGEAIDIVMAAADAALYQAKRLGRDRYVVAPLLEAQSA